MDNNKKDTLFSLLKDNNEEKIKNHLLENGKRKIYSPIYINKNIDIDKLQQETLKNNQD